ncbi:MAG TPA: arginase family protein, partial [Bacteroidales bacterium]|nr:arginase family protein [Bacteroidales bacterium]
MLDLKDYFDPVSIDEPEFLNMTSNAGFPHNISIHTENDRINPGERFKVVLIGVPDGRNSPNPGSDKAPDAIRQQLYNLAKIPGKIKIADLGNMKQGMAFNDTIAGLTDILVFFMRENIFPVIIGGSSALITAIDRS